jgi:hypothetical protein
MKARQFLSIMGVVALVALIYSPSTIGFSASPNGDGGTAPNDTSPSGTSMFLSYLRSTGYHVTVANTSQQVATDLGGRQKLVYMLIGPDKPLSAQGRQAVSSGYSSGRVSALIAEGNTTNADLLNVFGASTSGAPIVNPTSSFQDKRVFPIDLTLGSATTTGLIDIASSLILTASSPLHVAASTTNLSCSQSPCPPSTALGKATVVAAGTSPSGSRAIVLADSAPFTNFLFNYTQPQSAVDEKAFVAAMVSWVDPAKNATILFDNSLYAGPSPPKFQAGLSIWPLVAYVIEQDLSGLNSYYASFPSQISGYLGGFGIHVSDGVATAMVALVLLTSVYGAVTRWFAPEKKGRDDLPPPNVERTIVAESRDRVDFLQTSRSKAGYVATLAQLYELLDSIVTREFGKGLTAIEEGELASKVGADEARRAKRLFESLSKLHSYSSGKKRFLFPPVLRWRALTSGTTRDAEAFLNMLGITIAGEAGSENQKVEQLMRERARA